MDDPFEAIQLLLVNLDVLQSGPDARQHAQHLLHGAHAPNRAKLFEEVVHGEPALGHLLGRANRLVLADFLLGLLDQRHNVAHAEDAPRHALRVKLL